MNKFFIILLLTFTISATEKTEITPENCSEQYKQEYNKTYNEALSIKSGKGYGGRLPSNDFGQSPQGQLYTYQSEQLYIYVKGLAKDLIKAREDAIADVKKGEENKFTKTAQ